MKKAGKRWIDFDFSVEDEKSLVQKQVKVKQESFKKSYTPSVLKKRNFNFELKLKPKIVTDLAVHPKKVKEVEAWLDNNVIKKVNTQHTATFLLITGPTGSGKTTTFQVLCNSKSIDLLEWTNPVDQDFEIFAQSQVTRFKEFLTESKWNSLFASSSHKIIIVEDYPNAMIRNPSNFFEVLEHCYYKGDYPVVFICSDSFVSDKNLPDILFPQEIKNKYNFTHISFNSCAATILKNALRRAHNLVQENLDLFKIPSADTVDAIIASSMGDIRCAINQYYFASLLGTSDLPSTEKSSKKQGNKRKRTEKVSSIKVMSRDSNLGLFHGLGRVLNPKRIENGDTWRLNCDLEKLIDEFSTQPRIFTSFLFENYLKYFGDLNEANRAVEILSFSQTFLEKWVDHHDTLIFALWVAVMGLMICNEHRTSKWNQIQGPKRVKKRIQDEHTRHFSVTDLYYYNIITKNETSQFLNK